MKRIQQLSFLLFLLFGPMSQMVSAQSACINSKTEVNTKLSDYTHVNTYPYAPTVDDMEFCVKVYVHNIEGNDPANGVPEAVLNTQINDLNNYFSGTDIHFDWDGNILDITNQAIYDANMIYMSGPCLTGDFTPLESYATAPGIHLFFHGAEIGASGAYGIADKPIALFTRSHVNTSILAHEVGHLLGLFHTNHGTEGFNGDGTANNSNCENNDGFSGHVVECPDGSNADIAGDYVYDTEATTSDYTFTASTCTGNPTNDPSHPCGVDFDEPELNNFMASHPLNNLINCQNTFSNYQVIRMKYFLWEAGPVPSLPLHDALLTCPTDPPPCTDCDGAILRSNRIFDTLTQSFADPCEYTLQWPTSPWSSCVDHYTIEWNGGLPVTLDFPNASTSTIFTSPGTQTVTITETLTSGVVCSSQVFTFEVDNSCNSTSCPDCSDVMNDIASSLTLISSIGCDAYSIDIPDLDGCYKGRVDWGDFSTPDNFVSNTTITHNYTAAGPYTITLQLFDLFGNKCAKTTIGIQVSCNRGTILLFPNPTGNKFTISNNSDREIASITVQNHAGKVISEANSNFNQAIDISTELPGIYFVKVNFSDGTSIVEKIILQK